MPRPVEPSSGANSGANPPATGERIAKLLARAGIASRREVERMIAEGRIARDGVALDTAATVLGSLAGITVDGNPVAAAEPARLFLYHKPPGLLVTERDPRGRPTIYDRLPKELPRVVPVGRLDLGTEGLLMLTTDGGFKRQLELPATGVERTYRARVYGQVGQPLLETLVEGIEIDGFRYGPIDANLERRTGANSWIELTLAEGKNREVRRVLEHLGLEVSRLIRTRYGPFVLGDLPPGDIGEVRQADLIAFRQTLGKRGSLFAPIEVKGSSTGQSRGASRPAHRATPRPQPHAGDRPPRDNPHPRDIPHPGEGRGPVAAKPRSARPDARVCAGATPRSNRTTISPTSPSTSQLRPAPRRDSQPLNAKPAPAPKKPAETPGTSTRPARIQRKPGWARPKPKNGPAKPRKR